MPDLAEIKARTRRAIHGRLAVPALYYPNGSLDDPADPPVEGITVRWHNKIDTTGDLDGSYGSVIEGIDRLIFLRSNIADVNAARVLADPDAELISLRRGALVEIAGYQDALFHLDSEEPADGPEEIAWVVARQRT